MSYIHENPDWPHLKWDNARLLPLLADVRYRQGLLLGRMESIGFQLRAEATLTTLTSDVIKSSAIEGAHLDAEQVRSSIARRLGLDFGRSVQASRDVEGVVEMMLDATQTFSEPLTAERLFAWHASLFPTGRSGMRRITVGAWRSANIGPMQVVSGPIGRERVHFEAPSADRLAHEVALFLDWFEAADGIDPVLKAGIAHFWFVTIHPFEDGNGRISRAIADMAMARAMASRNASTACPRRSKPRRSSITCNWSEAKGTGRILPPGSNGSWVAWDAPSQGRRTGLQAFCEKQKPGNASTASRRSMRGNARSSTGCWMALREHSPRQNTPSSPSAPATRH